VKRIEPVVERAQQEFARLLNEAARHGPVTIEQYTRYLSMQYHLTRGVQRYFFAAASHGDLARRRKLRKFLVDFANEEELHYVLAENDLRKLEFEPLPEPLDVALWHSYFEKVVSGRPFLRLGAACILETISAGVAAAPVKKALSAPFLTRENSRFLTLHQHEDLPHGQQIIEALAEAALEEHHLRDVLEGARKATVMYLRMADWALHPGGFSSFADGASPAEAEAAVR
jgi:hypothetical protein